MKILMVTRDIKMGIGTTVKNLVWQFEQRPDVEKITVVAPGTFEVKTNKVEFKLAPMWGKYFFTKEITFGISAFRALKEAMKNDNYDIIHLHSNVLGYRFLPKKQITPIVSTFQGTHKALMKMSVPMVSTFHSTHRLTMGTVPINDLKYSLGKYLHIPFILMDNDRIKRSKTIACVSTYTLDEIKNDHKTKTSGYYFIPNGVKTDVYHKIDGLDKHKFWKEKFNIDDPRKKLLYIGRLESGKGVMNLAEAVKGIPNAMLIFVGEGPEKEVLEKNEFVRCVGYVTDEALKNEIINASDLMVFPSLYENFPLVIGEAMSAELPLISTKVGMVPYMLQNSESELCEPGDVEEMRDKIITLLNNPTRQEELRKINRDFAVKNLNWKIIADEYINLYTKVNNEQIKY